MCAQKYWHNIAKICNWLEKRIKINGVAEGRVQFAKFITNLPFEKG